MRPPDPTNDGGHVAGDGRRGRRGGRAAPGRAPRGDGRRASREAGAGAGGPVPEQQASSRRPRAGRPSSCLAARQWSVQQEMGAIRALASGRRRHKRCCIMSVVSMRCLAAFIHHRFVHERRVQSHRSSM